MTITRPPCHPPVFLDEVLEDPAWIREITEVNAPYYPVQRYFGGDAEYRASAGRASANRPVFIAPVFRGNWAYDEPLVEGAERLLGHPGFAEAARKVFGGGCLVRPFSVYSNLTWQLPFDQGAGHTDIPEFRGVSRSDHPTWILSMMGHSGLFEAERVRIATVVAWFYEGQDGGFSYWPDGPAAPARIHEGGIFNTACAGDNDRMYHRVRPTGERAKGLPMGMTLDTRLEHRGGDAWRVVDGERTLGEMRWPELRLSVSWKARIFEDAAEERRYRDHSADIDIDEVFERFYADLDRRGVAVERTSNPSHDQALVEKLAEVYVEEPSVFEAQA